jgi:hypothetical protein
VKLATDLELDDRLIEEALRIGGRATVKETVTEALQEYIDRRKQATVLGLFGTIDYDPKYDHLQRAVAGDGSYSQHRSAIGCRC